MAQKNVKKRNWAFVLYPESAPEDWREQLQKTGLQGEISPLHDRDENPDKTPKKAHYHVILCYSGPTSYNVVKALTDSLNQPIPQPLEQVRGYHRYLTHMDNPEKYQYDPADIETFNGFSILDYTDITKSESLEIKRRLMRMVRELHITEYAALCNLLDDSDMVQELEVAVSNTMFFRGYVESMRYIFMSEGGKSDRRKAD